jgi:6-pyruvoyltetrahydropterin/6-carboxytetrahydropterin synthase
MFELTVRSHFSAAHCVVGHPGKCGNLHGHNWAVIATVQATSLNSIGLAVDFSDLKRSLNEILGLLDHRNLNELSQFSTRECNPTAENVARFVFYELRGRIRDLAPQAKLTRVDIFETDTCSASFLDGRD